MEQVTAELRVTNLNVKPWPYMVSGQEVMGEAVEVRAAGHWSNKIEGADDEDYPISLHFTVYPGHAIIPPLGDILAITINRQ